MINELSSKSRNSITSFMGIWFTMLTAQFIYLFVCYYMLEEGLYKGMYSVDILKENIFLGINLYTIIYVVALLIIFIGYTFFKKSYTNLVTDTNGERFKDEEEEFKFFSQKYITLMFVYLAIFEVVAILGLVVFLTTLEFNITLHLIILTSIGFILIMPNKNKFNYNRV